MSAEDHFSFIIRLLIYFHDNFDFYLVDLIKMMSFKGLFQAIAQDFH